MNSEVSWLTVVNSLVLIIYLIVSTIKRYNEAKSKVIEAGATATIDAAAGAKSIADGQHDMAEALNALAKAMNAITSSFSDQIKIVMGELTATRLVHAEESETYRTLSNSRTKEIEQNLEFTRTLIVGQGTINNKLDSQGVVIGNINDRGVKLEELPTIVAVLNERIAKLPQDVQAQIKPLIDQILQRVDNLEASILSDVAQTKTDIVGALSKVVIATPAVIVPPPTLSVPPTPPIPTTPEPPATDNGVIKS